MRHAEGKPSGLVRSPLAYTFNPLPRGWAGGGAAPLARSTPTLWAYAQRNAHKDTPKKTFSTQHKVSTL
ncbi:MAG: hypothetical protein NZ455_12045 [Bacteroidia bacterium]|nr:hypothetical protein [Bacteroidia bacterium]MDW8346640.1 hypothetical protein [Bacteroidia bacterium]